jgi:hypothetical protein
MSKGGGAGKVYFVLYLAVVLELLIIIVERDEAEENLLKKQRETMKIVESILSQLQSGAGTEGINTRPQDEITIPPADINVKEVLGADVKSFRKYIVEVGVTDVAAELKKKEGEQQVDYAKRLEKLIKLGNVEEIEYQIFFNPSADPNNAPLFPTDEEIAKNGFDFQKFSPSQTVQAANGDSWEFLALRKLKLDAKQIMNNVTDFNNINLTSIAPVYPRESDLLIGNSYAPTGKEDSVFYYQPQENLQSAASLLKRSFVVNFQPPRRAGWYKLRFASRTNRILGVHGNVSATNIPDDANINIGTVSLTAKDLKKVLKELNSKLEKYNPPTFEMLAVQKDLEGYEKKLEAAKVKAAEDENPTEAVGKIKLFDYIVKLLTPNMSSNFAQNRGAIEFNVRVILPEVKTAKPELVMPSYTPTFDKLPGVFEFTASPWMGNNVIEGKVVDASNANVARIVFKALDEINPAIAKPVNGGKRDYRATIDQILGPGKYELIVTHRIGGGAAKEDRGTLEVFPTGLTESSKALTDSRMEGLYYGYQFPIMTPEASSGGKVKPETFRIHITTDKETQRSPIQGLAITRDNGLLLDCGIKTATLRITWVQPYSDQEVDVYSANTQNVRQKAPSINTGEVQTSVDEIGTNRLRVTVRNIKVVPERDGKNETSTAQAIVDVDKKAVLGNLAGQGVEQYSDVTISKDGDNYKAELTLNVNMPKGQDMINGQLTIKVIAKSKNSCNPDIVSKGESKSISTLVKYEPQNKGRGGRGGGTAPSGGGRGGKR